METADERMRADALVFSEAISSFWQDRLGDRLLGFYLLGSLAHGGFNRRYSDIDLGLIADGGLDEEDLEAMRTRAAAVSPVLAPKLSLFWADREFTVGRFPPLDRLDYLDHAKALVERERITPPRPSLSDVRNYLQGTPFANWQATVDRFVHLDRLEPADHKPCLRAHLYPARFAFSWLTGRMASNDAAVAFLRDHPPGRMDISLLEMALACRHAARDPDDLFAERKKLPRQADACRALITA